jgi:hypothetical protein
VDPETAELAAFWPKLIKANRCSGCLKSEEAAEMDRRQAEAARREQAAREARLQAIPPEMLRTRPDHPDFNGGLWLRTESWRPSALRWLGVVGLAGNCKTRCLALLAKELILAGHRLMWTTAVEFQDRVDDLRGDRRPIVADAHEYLARCKSAPVLVLDDIGKNTWTPAIERHLFGLLDHRKTHDLPVLWSANSHPMEILQSGQLTKERGGPLIGRLLEASKLVRA